MELLRNAFLEAEGRRPSLIIETIVYNMIDRKIGLILC
jgi:hypothetical protein